MQDNIKDVLEEYQFKQEDYKYDFKLLNMTRAEFGEYAKKQGEEWRKNHPELMGAYHASDQQYTGTEIVDIIAATEKVLDKYPAK